MTKRSGTVRDLALASGLDLEETLITLWEAGVEDVTDADDLVPTGQWKTAQRALGLPVGQDYRKPEFWRERLSLDEDEFAQLLELAEIRMSPTARKLPKGAPRKLRLLERELVFPPQPPPAQDDVETHDTPRPAVRWRNVGRAGTSPGTLSAEMILGIHHLLELDAKKTDDPIAPPGVRNEGLLESAVFRQHTAFEDHLKYPTAEMSAAALLHSLVNNHAFFNGNKRTALVSMAVSLFLGDLRLTCSKDELFKLVLRSAQHKLVEGGGSDLADREVLHLAEWIRSNTRRIQTGEKVVTWLKLKRILSRFGVMWEHPRGMGNRINLYRKVSVVTRKGRKTRTKNLYVQVAYRGEGTEVATNTLKRIRETLYLDMEHDYDSAVFYDQVERAEQVIIEYQSTLRRLAKF